MSLPKNEKTFQFDVKGEMTSHRYEGSFTVKCMLSVADKRALEIEQSRLSMDLKNPTDNLSALSRIIANLRVRVLDAPEWFNQSISSLDFLDDNVMFELYSKCLDMSAEWKEELDKKLNPPKEEDGEPGNDEKESKSSPQ